MIRKKPVFINGPGKHIEANNIIHGLECLEPFVSFKYHEYMLYTTESLTDGTKIPLDYIYKANYNGSISGRNSCIGSFYKYISQEEKDLFCANIIEINKLLQMF